ncbi:MAG: CDP-alcohol phosphatidyltransferase family protein [Vampirovibrionales bacterium]
MMQWVTTYSQRVGWANTVSCIRMLAMIPFAYWVLTPTSQLMVPVSSELHAWTAFVLAGLIIWMDGWDGYLARRFQESSAFGALWDILCDRVVEQTFWVVFLVKGWVPLWAVLAIIWRGILVDGIRGLAHQSGKTAFGTTSIMQHWLGIALVSSRASRWGYAVLKAVYFALCPWWFLSHQSVSSEQGKIAVLLAPDWLYLCMLGVVVCCWIRAIPVWVEMRAYLKNA